MFKAVIRPEWRLLARDREVPPKLLALLVGIHENGSLAAACRRTDISYRYAWGLLRDAEILFEQPLVRKARGRGAELTTLGETLVWADRRVQARLSPTLDMLASEIEVEIERCQHADGRILRIHATHGFAVETLSRWLADSGTALELKYAGSDDVLSSLRSGRCDLAGLHLPIGVLENEVFDHYAARLDPGRDRVLYLASRRQGLIVAPGNPLAITSLTDLTRPGLRFINRQPGSGTRLLVDLLLRRDGIDPARIDGYDTSEFTHAAVAAYVASGMADAGFGLETPAQRFRLSFLPLLNEHYFFLFDAERLAPATLASLREILASDRFRAEVSALPGYDASHSGSVRTLDEAFPAARARRR